MRDVLESIEYRKLISWTLMVSLIFTIAFAILQIFTFKQLGAHYILINMAVTMLGSFDTIKLTLPDIFSFIFRYFLIASIVFIQSLVGLLILSLFSGFRVFNFF